MTKDFNHRILYIEDSGPLCDLFVMTMEKHGFYIETSETGKGGLDKHQACPFTLAVVDYQLPDMTGLDVIKELLSQTPELPIIMVTGKGNENVAAEALGLGIQNYVIKKDNDVYLHVLPQLIRTLLNEFEEKTNRIIAESSLKDSFEQFNRGLAFANIGTWNWNILSGDLHWSERIAPLFGYEDGAVDTTYENFVAAIHPDDREAVVEAVNACVKDGDNYDIEHRVVWADGTVRWLHERGDVSRDENNVANHMLGVVQDITDRKNARAQLASREKQLAAMFSSAATGMITINSRGIMAMVNPAAEKMFGYQKSDLLGKTVNILMPESDSRAHDQYMDNYDKTGKATVIGTGREVEGMRKDGSVFPIHLSLSTHMNDGENEYTAVIIDISKRKHAEQALEEANEHLEERVLQRTEELQLAMDEVVRANQIKSEFMANMSHEFRTPLNAIIGFSDMIRNQYLGPIENAQYVDYANDISGSSEHLLSMVNEILDIEQIESGTYSITKEPIDIKELAIKGLRYVEQSAATRNIVLEKDVPDDLPSLCADRQSVMQIVTNLLSNAVKFSHDGGNVLLSVDYSDGQFTLKVIDHGIGIPHDKISTVTAPFSRHVSDPHRAYDGIGLGLAITKTLVEQHDGALSIESELGRGTTVCVILPENRKKGLA